MRKRYIQIDGVLYEKGTEPQPVGVQVIPDINPYRSMIDGTMITSRSKHREHLKANHCVEVGNDIDLTPRPLPDVSPQKRKELIVRQIMDMPYDDFKKMLHRDVQNAKWNSRKD